MSEVLTRGPGNVDGVSATGLLLSCSALLLSSLGSHPNSLFSYLVKLIWFLGPLLFTTFIVLLALLTLSTSFVRGGTSESEPGLSYRVGVCLSILNKFRNNVNEGNGAFFFSEHSKACRIIFEAPDMDSGLYGSGNLESLPPVYKFLIHGDDGFQNASSQSKREENNPAQEIASPDVEPGKKLGALFLEKQTELEAKVKAEDENSKNVVDQEKQIFHDGERGLVTGSESTINDHGEDDIKNKYHNTIFGRRRQGSRRSGEISSRAYENILGGGEIDRNLGSFGSMSRSKEWKRTLACKLFEERRNSEGEGMDSLWETYDDESSKKDATKTRKEKKIKGWKKERVDISCSNEKVAAVLGDEDEGDGDEAGMDNKFCCLQAFRLSTGRKMGLGMGRPNIVRISKVFRGIGWLQHHVSHCNGKKG